MRVPNRFFLLLCLVGISLPSALAEEKKPSKPKMPVAGKADVMKHVRKKFATLLSVDIPNQKIRLHIEGDEEESLWPVLPDAEVKVHGWWGRLEQLPLRDRVWVWFAVDRDKNPRAVLMVADEMSEQDIHDEPSVIKAVEEGTLTLHVPEVKEVPERVVQIAESYAGPREVGEKVYAQTSGGVIRDGVSGEEFEARRRTQQEWLRNHWRVEGLPGTVSTLHPLGGEMELLLDHEAIRWGRYLKTGEDVTLRTKRPIKAVVHSVKTWRERTQVRLVTNSGLDQLDLTVGQRLELSVPEPPSEVQESNLPPDLGRLDGKPERLEWFLDTIYCSCGIAGDKCTGMYYTQASCNRNGCGMPNEMLRIIGKQIDEGRSDAEIFAKLLEDRGRDLWRPHLLR